MKRLLKSPLVNQAMRAASLVVTDRRWAAPLSAAALGFGIFAGVAIGPGAAGTLATGAQQIIHLPSSGGDEGQSGGGAGPVASTESPPPLEASEAGGDEEAIPSSVPLAPKPVEPLPPPAPEPTPKPASAAEGDEEEAEEETQSLKGTVVHANPAAGSYAMAIRGGELVSVHAPKLPEPGTKLSGSFTRLANGTFAEADDPKEEKAAATEATFRGAVTYTDPDPVAPAYTVSGRGSSLLVHLDPDPTGAAPNLPPIGTYVIVTAAIEKPHPPAAGEAEAPSEAEPTCAREPTLPPPATFDPVAVLVQREIEVEDDPPSSYLDLSSMLTALCPDSGQLLLSADDAGESGGQLTLDVPAAIATAKLRLDGSFLATATVEEDGSLTLSGLASDEQTRGADDSSSAQGDLKR
jgi:hypothetical protein